MELIAEKWAAEKPKYPLDDHFDIARVSLFKFVKSLDRLSAERQYREFLKRLLLNYASKDPKVSALVPELEAQRGLTFSAIVQMLNYPQFEQPDHDTLRILARLPISTYITTSYFDFMEDALLSEGRTPVRQVFSWSGDGPHQLSDFGITDDFRPSPQKPVVYHLFGHEKFPKTLVLSEDDFLVFMATITQPLEQYNPVLPYYLNEGLKEKTLILLGYRLRDWDFRILFRGAIQRELRQSHPFSLVVQLNPERTGMVDAEEVKNYLAGYFKDSPGFNVMWTPPQGFVEKLWDEWRSWSSNQ